MIRFRVAAALFAALLVALMGAACSGDAEDGVTPAPEPERESPADEPAVETQPEEAESAGAGSVVRVADTGEGYQWINHELFGLIIEGGYGLEMELVPVDPQDLETVLESGDVDLHLEARTPETAEWFDAAVAEGILVNLGTIYETEDGFEVQKGATPAFVEAHPEVVAFLKNMDTRAGSLGKTKTWASRREGLTNQEVAAYYMYTFDFEDRMKSWMPFENYRQAKLHMETLYPEFRRCTNCPDADPDAPGTR